ncbi:MAG: mannitol dehydrogenase family protein [Pseudomonadota bacterium]
MNRRLDDLDRLTTTVTRPDYRPAAHGTGVLHFGVGAFHRAHQAPATDDALAHTGGDWRIEGVSLKRPEAAKQLNPQNGLYTLLVRGPGGTRARVIGALGQVHTAPEAPERVLDRLADPAVRVVSLTVTEKAYGLDPATGGLDLDHPAIRHDLATPDRPAGVVGYLVQGLGRRRAAGTPPFTPLSCDNLRENGSLLRRLALDFADRLDPELRRWIERDVPFPCTMVDRITPASTERTLADAARLTGFADHAAVETEPFVQWVLEDRFASGRPAWEAGGALFVDDVRPYETMKLRMLNGAHSLIAYLGVLGGLEFVRDVMARPALASIVSRHMRAAARTLESVPGVDLERYASDLATRFANPAIAHHTRQIAMDGTQKLPQRLLEPALVAAEAGSPLDTYAVAVAAWMRYASGRDDHGRSIDVVDPRDDEIRTALRSGPTSPADIIDSLVNGVPGLFPERLARHRDWREMLERQLDRLCSRGVIGLTT